MQRNNNTKPRCTAGVVNPINVAPVPLLSTRWRHIQIQKITIMARLQSTDFIAIQGRRRSLCGYPQAVCYMKAIVSLNPEMFCCVKVRLFLFS